MITYFLNDPPPQNQCTNGFRDYRNSAVIPYQSTAAPRQQNQPQSTTGSFRPNVINNSDSNYSKKSYNYMASPNYLQYENTYQKFKKICHNKDVSNFRDNNCNGNGSSFKQQRPHHEYYDYQDDNNMENDNIDHHYRYDDERRSSRNLGTNQINANDNLVVKANNTMQTLSSDDEGGFRRDMLNITNHFNNSSNVNSSNGNIKNNYSTKESEPLLNSSNLNGNSIQITKVSRQPRGD